MDKQVINQLVSEALSENNSLFLISLSLHQDNKIVVQIDGDQGVSLKECIRVSRFIENNLDKEIEDYALEVTTPDITEPLTNIRQYHKNLHRTLIITLKNQQKIEGVLTQINEDSIILETKVREPKPLGKGKITVVKNHEVPFSNIEKTLVKIIF